MYHILEEDGLQEVLLLVSTMNLFVNYMSIVTVCNLSDLIFCGQPDYCTVLHLIDEHCVKSHIRSAATLQPGCGSNVPGGIFGVILLDYEATFFLGE